MADPSKQYPPGYNPGGGVNPTGIGPLREALIIEEFFKGVFSSDNRQTSPPRRGMVNRNGFLVDGIPLPALPPIPFVPRPLSYITPPVIPASRQQPSVESLPEADAVKRLPSVGFVEKQVSDKVSTVGGPAGLALVNKILESRKIGLLPVKFGQATGFTKFALGLPGGIIGALIATSGEAGAGEESQLNQQAAARQIAREAAAAQIEPLTGVEAAAVRQALGNNATAAALIDEFNATTRQNLQTLAAGLAVDAARASVGLDLATVGGAQAVARREAFVAGLLGLMLPNNPVAGVTLFAPEPWQGDP